MAQATFPLRCIDSPNSSDNCKSTFEAKCPAVFKVVGVYGIKAPTTRSSCKWIVHYSYASDAPIPRNESKAAERQIRLGGNPEDADFKGYTYSVVGGIKCLCFEYVCAQCQCGFLGLSGLAINAFRGTVITSIDRGPVKISTVEFTANGFQVRIIDESIYSKMQNSDDVCRMAMLVTGNSQCITTSSSFYIAMKFGQYVVAVGGHPNEEEIEKYFSELTGENVREMELLRIWHSFDDNHIEYLECFPIEAEVLPSVEDISQLVDSSMKPLMELFQKHSTGGLLIPDSPISNDSP